MLYEVGIWPYLLVRIAGHIAVRGEELGRVLNMVFACCPRRTVTGSTANLREEFLTLLEVLGSGIASSRNSQAAMPYHQVLVLRIRHLRLQRFACQICVNILLEVAGMPFRMLVHRVHKVDVLRKSCLHVRVLRRLRCIVFSCEVEIVVTAVRTGHVGDVPYSIGTRSVKDRATRHGVGIAAHILRAVALQRIGVVAVPGARSLIPHGWIQGIRASYAIEIVAFLFPLGRDFLIGNGIGQTRTIDADGGFEQHTYIIIIFTLGEGHIAAAASHDNRSIVGTVGNGHLGIYQRVCLTVRELIAPLIGIVIPRNLNLVLIDRSLERFYSTSLRHTGHRTDVGIGGLVIYNEQVAVAVGIGLILRLACSVTIARMAVQAASAHIDRAETVEGSFSICVIVFLKEILALVEGSHHACILHSFRRLFEGGRSVYGSSAKQTAGIIVFRIVGGCRVANLPCGWLDGIIITGTTSDDE